jgi:hypothetical protein
MLLNLKLFSPSLAYELCQPADPQSISESEKPHWETLDAAAEERVVATYPRLKDPPSNVHIPEYSLTTFRLFRYIVPVQLAAYGDNSIIFLGHIMNGRVQDSSGINSLCAVAYLEDLLPPSTEAFLRKKRQWKMISRSSMPFRGRSISTASPSNLLVRAICLLRTEHRQTALTGSIM